MLTEKRLKKIIRDVLEEHIDPDYGFELREEVEQKLNKIKKEEKNGDSFLLENLKKEIK